MASFICYAFLCSLVSLAHGQNYQNAYKLQQDLFSNYSKSIRPLQDQTRLLTLRPSFDAISLVRLDEITQTIVLNGFLTLQWKDELLTWDPANYNGITQITPESTLVWKPRMYLLNTMSDRDLFKDDFYPITIFYDGRVEWSPGGLFPALCKLDLRKFPFDKHRCGLDLSPNYMNASVMQFDMTNAFVSYTMLIPNGEWDITHSGISSTLSISVGDDYIYPTVTIEMVAKRKPIFFVLNILFPVFFLSVLNVLSFLIPASGGEKIGFSVSVLLSMSVYMGIVSTSLPSNSENMPYMAFYIFQLFGTSVLCCIDTIVIVLLNHKEDEEEKKQKRHSKLNNVASKLKFMNGVKQHPRSGGKSKIFPSPPGKPASRVEADVTESRDGELSSDASYFNSNEVRHSGFESYNSSVLIEKLKTGMGPCKDGDQAHSEERYLNRYKNIADKLNFYSGIVFCLVSVIMAVIVSSLVLS